jgi:heme a synthase
MQSKLVGAWLLSTSAGVLGLITLGGYTRLKRAGLSMVDWKPLSLSFPTSEAEWAAEFSRYQQFPEYQQSRLALEDFKEIYFIEYSHRLVARALGLYLALPLVVFWRRGLIPTALKPKMLGISALFGAQAVMGWLMVRSGLQHKEYDGRVKVEPVNLALHLFLGVGIFSLLFSAGIRSFGRTPEEKFGTVEKYLMGKKCRRKYMMVLHLALGTMFFGGLVAGSDAGKVMTNWPFYGNGYVYPENLWEKEPGYRNFFENKEMIQFVHRNFGYLTFLSVVDLWRFFYRNKAAIGFMGNAHLLMLVSTFQVILGITSLMRGSPFYESLTHQTNGLLMITTVLYGLSTFKMPNKAFIAKLMGK